MIFENWSVMTDGRGALEGEEGPREVAMRGSFGLGLAQPTGRNSGLVSQADGKIWWGCGRSPPVAKILSGHCAMITSGRQ